MLRASATCRSLVHLITVDMLGWLPGSSQTKKFLDASHGRGSSRVGHGWIARANRFLSSQLSAATAVTKARTIASTAGCSKSSNPVMAYYTEELTSTWLSHWEREEEQRQLRRAILRATRSRQLQRCQQINSAVAAMAAVPVMLGETDAVGLPLRDHASSTAETCAFETPGHEDQECSDAAVEPVVHHSSVHAEILGDAASSNSTSVQLGNNRMSDLEWLYGMPGEDELELEEGDWQQEFLQPRQSQGETGLLGPQRIRLKGRTYTVQPLWIAVLQKEGSLEARLFESVVPLDDDVLNHMRSTIDPLCITNGLIFGEGDLEQEGARNWRNYFVGLVGGVGAVEEDVLWPNQVLHQDRVMHNLRDALDLARFLALPAKADMEQHLNHLKRIATERGYQRRWCWYMLRQRWGEAALTKFDMHFCE